MKPNLVSIAIFTLSLLAGCGGQNDAAEKMLAQTVSVNGVATGVLTSNRANYTVAKTSTGYTATDTAGSEGVVAFGDIQRLQFADGALGFDTTGNAGKAYRLYQAAFDRVPDLAGLGLWIDAMDKGMSITDVSHLFEGSAEFVSLYGANTSNAELVTLLYRNVLHREPEDGALPFWVGILDSGQQSRELILANFSESLENQAQVSAAIQNGIVYETYVAPLPSNPNGKIVGGYYPWWLASPIRIKDLNPNYNLVYLFAATAAPGDTSGAVRWQAPADVNGAWTNWSADIQYARTVQHRKIILSVGGAGAGMSFPDRTTSTNFVNSIDVMYTAWGGFDGLDWNTFEASQTPSTSEMVWMSLELKRRHPGFIITAPPAPWNTVDQTFCKAMLDAGALDYCAPQYYDGPNLANQSWIVSNIATWMNLLGPSHVVVGFGVDPSAANYETIDSAVSTWTQIKATYPAVHGAFDWQINNDAMQGYPFANRLGPLVP